MKIYLGINFTYFCFLEFKSLYLNESRNNEMIDCVKLSIFRKL